MALYPWKSTQTYFGKGDEHSTQHEEQYLSDIRNHWDKANVNYKYEGMEKAWGNQSDFFYGSPNNKLKTLHAYYIYA